MINNRTFYYSPHFYDESAVIFYGKFRENYK